MTSVSHAAPTGSTRRRIALFALLTLLVGVIPVARAMRAGAVASPPYTVAVGNVTANENNSGQRTFSFTLTLSPPAVQEVLVNYETADPAWDTGTVDAVATAGTDYLTKVGTVTFAPTNATKSVSVIVLGDTVPEPNEMFSLLAEVQGVEDTPGRGTGTIVNDDGTGPTLAIADTQQNEGDSGSTTFGFTVTRTGNTTQAVDFRWGTADDSTGANPADSTADYSPVADAVGTIAAGDTSTVVNVTVTPDLAVEMNETFNVVLKQVHNAGVSDSTATGTILDDDEPALTFTDPTEGDDPTPTTAGVPTGTNPNLEDETTRTFTVDFADTTMPSGRTVTVDYTTSNDTATAPGDYTAKIGTLTFVPGDVSEDIVVNIHEDSLPEGNEEFKVTLSNPGNAVLGANPVARGIIVEDTDDPDPSIAVSNPTVTEPDAGTVNADFVVTLSSPSGETVTVDYTTVDGTATQPADYTLTASTLTFTPGQTSKTVTVPVKGDTTAEGNENFSLQLSNEANATLCDPTTCGTATITDDETVTVSVIDAAIEEANLPTTATMPVSVVLSTAIDQPTNVLFHTDDGTAKATQDYTDKADGSTVTIPAGQTSADIEITITSDNFGEPTETFSVVLESSDVAAIADGTAVAEISDDDTGVPTVSIADASNDESGDVTFNVTLTGTRNPNGTDVHYTVTPGTATSADGVEPETGTVTFGFAETGPKTIVVTVVDDTVDELAETFTVTLSDPSNATIDDGEATGTITDNDGPTVAIDDKTVTEGNAGTTNAVFTVAVTGPSLEAFDVDYTTADDTAEDGEGDGDYTATTGTLTFPANSSASQTISVPVVGDIDDEPNESFKVNLTLTDDAKADIGDGEGIGTIIDDDGPAISIADAAAVTEGLSGTTNASFSVTLSVASAQVVTVDYNTADETATAGADYTASTGTVTFPAGSTTQTINVPVKGDNVDEDNETFLVVLSNATNANITEDDDGQGTINDDDAAPAMSIGDQQVTEADNTAVPVTLTVTLSRASSKTVTANYATANGTATAPGDYTAKSGTVTFTPGQTAKGITVLVAGDHAVESNETFFVDLATPPTNATMLDPRGQATIVDNDSQAAPKQGYWLTARDAGIFAFGDSKFHGSKGGQPLNAPIVGMASTETGNGYWQVASDGGIFSWGDATFFGSKGGQPLNKPVVGMASTADGNGYWLVASDGGIFTFGNAKFWGSKGGQPLNQPIVGMAATPNGGGYWLVASDGGIFTFGNAGFYGSTGGRRLDGAIIGMGRTPSGSGYWLGGSDGAVFAFGDAQALGSMGGQPLNAPIVGIAVHPG